MALDSAMPVEQSDAARRLSAGDAAEPAAKAPAAMAVNDAAKLPADEPNDPAESGSMRSLPEEDADRIAAEDDAGAAGDLAPVQSDVLVGRTTALSVVVGMYSDRYAGELYGTDLGYTFAHEGELWVLFGDSWRTNVISTTQFADDAFARISLADFPNGDAVEAWVRARPVAPGVPSWRVSGPAMDLALERGPGSRFAPIRVFNQGTELFMGEGMTPLTGFSNARTGAESGVFAVFFRYAHVECDSGQCEAGYACDGALGRTAFEQFNPPCLVGQSQNCAAGAGFCQDRGSSMYSESELGRTKALVVRHEVGFAASADPPRFDTRGWDTHRFFNLTARTVEDFDPARAGGEDNDYRVPAGAAVGGDAVLLWGRPHFAGVGRDGRDAQLYFAWAPMPVRDAAGQFEWSPRYFAGLDSSGRPQFAEREVDSKPLDLDAAISGEQPEERYDFVGQMSVSWLPSLRRWIMIYGGDIGESFAAPVLRGDIDATAFNPSGALFARFAEQPWGPWSAPRPWFTAGDRRRSAEAIDQYGPGGLLYHPNCRGVTCAGNDMSILRDPGALYAPSIIEPWTVETANEVHLYWLLSTWNPYHVVLMKTSLSAGDVSL